MMTLITVVDCETTGLDPEKDRIIELGAVLWEWESKRPVKILNDLLQCPILIPPEASKVNGIKDEDLQNYGSVPLNVLTDLHFMFESSQYLMGHNINRFDLPFIMAEFKRLGMQVHVPGPILDTLTDIKYRTLDASRKLPHLAAAHGIVNPYPHRAVFDALTTVQLASMYDLKDILARSQSASITIKANIGYDDRDKAKACGFRWDHQRWVKTIKECDAETFPFPTTRINSFYE